MTNQKEITKKSLKLISDIQNGFQPVVVIKNNIFEDSYLEKNMLAKIISVELEHEDDYIEATFKLDFSEFYETNKLIETANYNTIEGLKTATDANLVPSSFIEFVSHCISYDELFFTVKDNPVFEEYIQSKSKLNYTMWLEEKFLKLL